MTWVLAGSGVAALLIILLLVRMIEHYRSASAANFAEAKRLLQERDAYKQNVDSLDESLGVLREQLSREIASHLATSNQLDSLMDDVIKYTDAPAILVEAINAKIKALREK